MPSLGPHAAIGMSLVKGASTVVDDVGIWTTCLCSSLVRLPLLTSIPNVLLPSYNGLLLDLLNIMMVFNKTLCMMGNSGYKINP